MHAHTDARPRRREMGDPFQMLRVYRAQMWKKGEHAESNATLHYLLHFQQELF